MSGFGGVSFTVLDEDYSRGREARITEIDIPYCDVTVVDVGGLAPRYYRYTLLLASGADYDALSDQQGQTATLTGPDGSFTALLWRLDPIQFMAGGKVKARAEFRRP